MRPWPRGGRGPVATSLNSLCVSDSCAASRGRLRSRHAELIRAVKELRAEVRRGAPVWRLSRAGSGSHSVEKAPGLQGLSVKCPGQTLSLRGNDV